MNIVLDFNPGSISKKSLPLPKLVGWKAYDLLKTACYLKEPEFQNIAQNTTQNTTIPQGFVISSDVYDEYLKKEVVEKYLLEALKESIKEDPGLIEELADKMGMNEVIDKGEEGKVKDLIDEIIKKFGLEKVLQKIVVEDKYRVNFLSYLSNFISDKLDEIKNEIENKISDDILNSLKVNISEKQLSPVIYLRSSSYSKKREEWIEHAGAFGSIPCFFSHLDKKKIVWVYSRIFSSFNALQNVIKTGINTFRMAIFVQFVDQGIFVSGSIISSPYNDNTELRVEWKEGLDIPEDSIKELITDGSVKNVEVRGEFYFSEIDGRKLLFEANSGIYRKIWDIKGNRFSDHSNSTPELFTKRNVCIIVDVPYKKFNIATPENRKISEEISNEIYSLVTYLLSILNKGSGRKHRNIRIEFAITQDGKIQIIQCDPLEEKEGKNE